MLGWSPPRGSVPVLTPSGRRFRTVPVTSFHSMLFPDGLPAADEVVTVLCKLRIQSRYLHLCYIVDEHGTGPAGRTACGSDYQMDHYIVGSVVDVFFPGDELIMTLDVGRHDIDDEVKGRPLRGYKVLCCLVCQSFRRSVCHPFVRGHLVWVRNEGKITRAGGQYTLFCSQNYCRGCDNDSLHRRGLGGRSQHLDSIPACRPEYVLLDIHSQVRARDR